MNQTVSLAKEAFSSDASFETAGTRAERAWEVLSQNLPTEVVSAGIIDIEHSFKSVILEAYKGSTLPKDWAVCFFYWIRFWGFLPEVDSNTSYTPFGVWKTIIQFDGATVEARFKNKVTRKQAWSSLTAKPRKDGDDEPKTSVAELIGAGQALGNCAKKNLPILLTTDLSVLTPADRAKFLAGFDSMKRLVAALSVIIDPPKTV